ncbi:MAG: cytochrome P460 family protein, partial [Deltaproteobacteria bacterium]|nr:cytochrome P460 family protein [Deltaproteobacteria bacterium]
DISGFVEARNCRKSADHEIQFIRVLVDEAAREPYVGRALDFPTGAVVLKAQYDYSDVDCTGDVVQWTVMRRADDAPAVQLGWNWQRVGADRKVVSENDSSCFGCHTDCTSPPDFYRNTCAVP